MIALSKIFSNAAVKPNGKCPVDEAVTKLIREAEELREAVRKRKQARTDGEAQRT